MDRKIIFLTLRAVLVLGVSGFILLNAQDWLGDHWQVNISPPMYALASYAVLFLIMGFSTRSLVAELRKKKKTAEIRDRERLKAVAYGRFGVSHRYRWWVIFMFFACGVIFSALPYVPQAPRSINMLLTYVVCFCMAAYEFFVALLLLRYRLVLSSDGIFIRTLFRINKISFNEIKEIKLVRTKLIRRAIVVDLFNRKQINIDSMVNGFDEILSLLIEKTSGVIKQ